MAATKVRATRISPSGEGPSGEGLSEGMRTGDLPSGFTLRVFSYNIDSREDDLAARAGIVASNILDSAPDIVFLQEVKRYCIDSITRELALYNYKRILHEDVLSREICEVIFYNTSRLRPEETGFKMFPNSQFRHGITYARLSIFDVDERSHLSPTIVVATSKFDVSSSKKNLDFALKTLEGYRHIDEPVIIGCDTLIRSFDRTDIPQNYQHIGWWEAWLERGSSADEFTVDSSYNSRAPPRVRDRPDRIYGVGATVMEYSTVRKEINPSSHYPVVVGVRL